MNLTCPTCGRINSIPENLGHQYRCFYCRSLLPVPVAPSGDTSEAVGLIGGAALGAAIGGPVGALIGGIIGVMIGRGARTNG